MSVTRASIGCVTGPSPSDVADAVGRRTRELVTTLERLDAAALAAPSRLPGWSRLTIACHLRYGAITLRRMTADAVAGRPTAYYPGGREAQRPSTLVPAPGESPADVVHSLSSEGEGLAAAWAVLGPDDWSTPVAPPRPADGGDTAGPPPGEEPTVDLAFHGVLRLTEVEVHGSDLDVGLDRWSDTFVEVGLPFRLAGLAARRRRPDAAPDVHARWLLRDTGGPSHLVTIAGPDVTVTTSPTGPDAPAPPQGTAGAADLIDATAEGSAYDLLAFLLGRPAPALVLSDPSLPARFGATFPGP